MGLGIMFHLIQPGLAGRGQVATEHVRHAPFVRQSEHACSWRLRGDNTAELFSEVRLDVLPGFLLVLGVLGPATDIWLLAGKKKIGLRNAAQLRES
jgi:hypothetical protein